MNKKMLAGALAIGIVLSSTGCSKKSNENSDDSSNYLDTLIDINSENNSVLDNSSDKDSSGVDSKVTIDDSLVVEKKEVINVARKLNPEIKIYQMTIDPEAFRLKGEIIKQ